MKLPRYLSAAALLEALNALMDREGFFELLKRLADSPKQED